MTQRFPCILDSTNEKFSPLVAAACFVSPTVCETLADVAERGVWSNTLSQTREGYVVQYTQSNSQHDNQYEDDGNEKRKEPKEPEAVPSPSKQPVLPSSVYISVFRGGTRPQNFVQIETE